MTNSYDFTCSLFPLILNGVVLCVLFDGESRRPIRSGEDVVDQNVRNMYQVEVLSVSGGRVSGHFYVRIFCGLHSFQLNEINISFVILYVRFKNHRLNLIKSVK